MGASVAGYWKGITEEQRGSQPGFYNVGFEKKSFFSGGAPMPAFGEGRFTGDENENTSEISTDLWARGGFRAGLLNGAKDVAVTTHP